MHSKKVAHCDMKPANILVDQDSNRKLFCALTDYGISQMYSENALLVRAFKVINVTGASIAFAAREVVSRLRTRADFTMELAFAGDIYSFGMIFLCLQHHIRSMFSHNKFHSERDIMRRVGYTCFKYFGLVN